MSFVPIFQFYEIGLDKYAKRNMHFTVPTKMVTVNVEYKIVKNWSLTIACSLESS